MAKTQTKTLTDKDILDHFYGLDFLVNVLAQQMQKKAEYPLIAGSVGYDQLDATLQAAVDDAGSTDFTELTGQIDPGQIAGGTISGVMIANGAVTATQIASGTITATQIAGATITGTQIAAGTLTSTHVQAGSINSDRLYSGAIEAQKIQTQNLAANSVTATIINAGSINTAHINAGQITATLMAADSISAGALQAGSVTTTKLAANAVVADKIGAGEVTASKLAAVLTISSTIQTDASPNARVALSTSGIYAYDASNAEKLGFDIATGSMRITGVLTAGAGSALPITYLTSGSLVTGTVFRLDSGGYLETSATNPRVVIDSAGLRAYNSSGVLTTQIDNAAATITSGTITGATIRTAPSGSDRIEISGNSIQFWQLSADSTNPTIKLDRDTGLKLMSKLLVDTLPASKGGGGTDGFAGIRAAAINGGSGVYGLGESSLSIDWTTPGVTGSLGSIWTNVVRNEADTQRITTLSLVAAYTAKDATNDRQVIDLVTQDTSGGEGAKIRMISGPAVSTVNRMHFSVSGTTIVTLANAEPALSLLGGLRLTNGNRIQWGNDNYPRIESATTSSVEATAQLTLKGYLVVTAKSSVIPTEDWTEVTSFGGSGSQYTTTPAKYLKDPFGFVHLQISILTGGSTITAGTTLFTMPVGYRPEWIVYTAPETAQGQSTWKAYIDTSGAVKHAGGTMSSGGFGYAFPMICYKAA